MEKLGFPSFFRLTLAAVILVFSVITTIDLLTNDDLLSSDKVLSSEDAQFRIRIQETKFREKLLNEVSKSSLNSSFKILDSISIFTKGTDELKKVLILNQLKSNIRSYDFTFKLNKSTSPLVKIQDLKITFEIDFDRLNNILLASNFTNINENIKYGNFIKTKYSLHKKIKIDYLIISILAILTIAVISYFYRGIHKSKKGALESEIEDIESDKSFLKKAKKYIKREDIDPVRLEKIETTINQLETKINNLNFKEILKTILYQDVTKAEKKSSELYTRSTLMLILGLFVAIAGIIIFYITLPDFSDIKDRSNYIALAIRPALVLFFIQSISFYLLKQYRTLINDYKYFHDEYLKKSRIFTAYQLLQDENVSNNKLKIIDTLLNLSVEENSKSSNNEDTLENPNDKILEIIKSALDKVK